MLRYALRRVLWSIPTLLATSLVLFFVTTLAPDPALPNRFTPIDSRLEDARRAQFFDLPRFFNPNPADVQSRAHEALDHMASNDELERAAGERTLQRLGGASLPYVLPLLESLPPDARRRTAVALAPVATRMGLVETPDLAQPGTAALFWTRFWDDRALDFTRGSVARAVGRLVEHGSDLREADLVALDTFALPELVHAMTATDDRRTLARLMRVARRACGRGPTLEANPTEVVDGPNGASATNAPPDEARRAVADWQEWWFVHATDFVALEGAERAIAVVTETRYGKWLRRAASGELGVSAIDGEPIAQKLRSRAPVTLLICGLAMFVSWALAVPIGAYGAWRRGRAFDVVSSAVMFGLYATPTFGIAELLRRTTASHDVTGGRIALAVIALAAGSLATLSRWQRTAMLDVVRQDFVRTAHAKGAGGARVLVLHALRNALMPTVTLAGLHLPALLGGAFVVEEVFGLPGLGYETLRAIEVHDSAWLTAVILAAAFVITLGLLASDVVYGALDPRVRDVLTQRQRSPS